MPVAVAVVEGSTENITITDRAPAGSAEVEAVLVGTRDVWTQIRNASLSDIDVSHGSVAGNIVQVVSDLAQPTEPRFTDTDQIVMLGVNLVFIPDAGDDELTFTIKYRGRHG